MSVHLSSKVGSVVKQSQEAISCCSDIQLAELAKISTPFLATSNNLHPRFLAEEQKYDMDSSTLT